MAGANFWPLLWPVVVTLSVLFVVYVMFNRMGNMTPMGSPKQRAPARPHKNRFQHRVSRFDTVGNILTAWRPIDVEAVVGDQEWMGERVLAGSMYHGVALVLRRFRSCRRLRAETHRRVFPLIPEYLSHIQ